MDIPPVALIAPATLIVAFACCALAARRHAMQTGASRGRVLLVSLVVAVVASLPVLLTLALYDGDGALGEIVGFAAFPLSLAFGVRFLRPPISMPGSKDALPVVEDVAFLARIAELAAAFGLSPPVVRLLRSNHGNLAAQAFAGGLFAPTLVVSDGIVHRLEPDERDAIVGHELAHVSTGSLWILMLAFVGGWALGVPFAGGLSFLTGALLTANLWAIVTKVVQRHYELVCDREAARVVGHAAVSGGLGKIHRVHVVPEQGWLPLLFHATASHPHHAVRAAALAEAEGGGDPAERKALAARARPHRIASVVMFAVWIGAVAATVRYGGGEEHRWLFATLLLLLLAKGPLLLIGLVMKKWRRQRRRVGFRSATDRWMRRGVIVGLVGYLLLLLPEPLDRVGPALIIPAGVVVIVAALRGRHSRKLRQRVGAPLARQAWGEAILAAEASPERLAKDPALQHDVALCRALAGDRAAARAGLEPIVRDWPEVRVASISLALLTMADAPERALAYADRLIDALPDDPIGPLLRGRALLKLGRIDEAEAAARAALAIEPDDASARTILSDVHLARGDVPAAAAACREAFEEEPGSAEVRLARARLAVASESREQARRAVEEAVEAAEAAPFAFLVEEARALRDALDARVDASGT